MQATHDPAHTTAGTPETPTPSSRRFDGKAETDADRRFFDLRESGYTGWIDEDGHPVQAEGPAGCCPTCDYLHSDSEPCWYDACTVCGGPYPFGPWLGPVCGTCAQAPENPDGDGTTTDTLRSGVTPAVTLR